MKAESTPPTTGIQAPPNGVLGAENCSAWRALSKERPESGKLIVIKQPGPSGERSFSAGHASKDGRYDFIIHSSTAPALMLTYSAEWCYVDEPNEKAHA
jgi:hypothetical protein